jgi:uncharacterized protein YdiU (UPF0061 family)
MSISGETIDFGPCAFMEAYDPTTVFSSIDHGGRYAYGNQPHAAVWNLARLAEALLPLMAIEAGNEESALDAANAALAGFEPQFAAVRMAGLLRKIGISAEREGDAALAEDLLQRMAFHRADFTLTFRQLCAAAAGPEGDEGVRMLFSEPGAYDAWAIEWRKRLEQEPIGGQARAAEMRKVNPAFIARNHLVEAALDAAARLDDFKPFEELLSVISHPYQDRPGFERYAMPARPEEQVLQTFCGT